jgi:RND family efflux transporter MFP subunit
VPNSIDTAPSRGLTPGRLVAGLVVLLLAAWFGLRVRTAMNTQAALAAERDQAARAGAAAAQTGPAATVAGVARRWTPEVPIEGSLLPVREADLAFKAAGRLSSIQVRLAERVKKGALLGTLEAAEAEAQKKAVDAQVHAAEAQLALAEDAARRSEKLAGSGSMPEAAATQAAEQRKLASAQLDAVRAQLGLADVALRNHVLLAPFAGAVTRVPPGTGAIVTPGAPLFRVEDTSTLRLAGTVGENDAPLVKTGAPVRIVLDGRTLTGQVTAVLSTVDAGTRRLPVEAEVKNDAGLYGGTFVRAVVLGTDEIPVLELPSSTLRPGAQDEVMVVKDGRLAARRVRFTTGAGGILLVRSGLDAGERVLLLPSAEAKEGDRVVTQ